MSTIQEFNDFLIDLSPCLLWQYDQAKNLNSLINSKQNWYDIYQSEFWQNWYNNVFNLSTCNIFGLSIWSVILNVPLYVPIEPEPESAIFGFNAYDPSFPELENDYWNFFGEDGSGANFSTYGQEITLTQQEQQFLLRLRYFQLSTLTNIAGIEIDGIPVTTNDNVSSTYSINQFLNYLCTNSSIEYSGTIYALDGLDMTMTYVFTTDDFPINLFNALAGLDIFPRPAGVGIRFIINNDTLFGFDMYNQNFGSGNFINEIYY